MQTRRNWPEFLVTLACFSLVIVGWLAVVDMRETGPSRSRSSASDPPSKVPRLELAKSERIVKTHTTFPAPLKASNVRIAKWSWLKNKPGSVMTANFSLENNGDAAVMDIQISCKLRGKSGTVLDTVKQTIYDEIPPWDAKRFTNIDFGFIDEQSDSALCTIVDVQ